MRSTMHPNSVEQPLPSGKGSMAIGVGPLAASATARMSPTRCKYDHDSPQFTSFGRSSNDRLRAAASFSPHHPPTIMAIRPSAGYGMGGGATLAAVAGSMGITIFDVLTPQRPLMVLNYSSSIGGDIRENPGSGIAKSIEGGKYSSNIHERRTNLGSGGITTMEFQPCPSILQVARSSSDRQSNDGESENYPGGESDAPQHISSSVLLATARGSGILIWDCSGRALSPLLGRLNASDCSGSTFCSNRGNLKDMNAQPGTDSSNSQSRRDDDVNASSVNSSNQGPGQSNTSGEKLSSNSNNSSAVLESIQPANTTSTSSAAVSTILSCGIGSSSAPIATKNNTRSSGTSTTQSFIPGDVSSIAWKGPLTPIVLGTCGTSACLWDLRLLSGVSTSGFGARPYARYVSSNDGHSRGISAGRSLFVDCAYNGHAFATLDSAGVVRIWDDRKNQRSGPTSDGCVATFDAFPNGGAGVGIANMSSKWVTWGLEESIDSSHGSVVDENNFVVKVWESASERTAELEVSESNVSSSGADQFHVTSRIGMRSAVAARVHPCVPESIVLLRTPSASPTSSTADCRNDLEKIETPGSQTPTPTGIVSSPVATAMNKISPPSSPPFMKLQSAEDGLEDKHHHFLPSDTTSLLSLGKGGWDAELWHIESSPTPPEKVVSTNDDTKVIPRLPLERLSNFGAQKIATFHGGRPDEDALCIAPGGKRGDASSVIAMDLALAINSPSAKVNEENILEDGTRKGTGRDQAQGELLMCCLTKSGLMKTYTVPEASSLVKQGNRLIGDRNVADRTRPTSAQLFRENRSSWWDGKEGVFDEETWASPSKMTSENVRPMVPNQQDGDSVVAPLRFDQGKLTQFEMDMVVSPFEAENPTGLSRMTEDDMKDKLSNLPNVDRVASSDDDVVTAPSAEEDLDLPIDPVKAARVPCPPLCGVAFSGGVGGLITFSNGPVKRMWSWYQANKSSGRMKEYSLKERAHVYAEKEKNLDTLGEETEGTMEVKNVTCMPKTVFDLIEMSTCAKVAQWGDEEHENNNHTDESSDEDSDSDTSSYCSVNDSGSESVSQSNSDDSYYHISRGDSRNESFDPVFDSYFTDSGEVLEGTSYLTQKLRKSENDNEDFAGLPSLSPSVAITRKFDEVIMNGQTPELANLLQLGEIWWLASDFSVNESEWEPAKERSDSEWGDSINVQRQTSDPHLPSKSVFGTKIIERSSSFSMTSSKKMSMMGNIKKLLDGSVAVTPPDQKLLNIAARPTENPTPQGNSSPESNPLGVYTATSNIASPAALDRIVAAQKLCMKNASIYFNCGQSDKANTWTLLAQSVESILQFESDEFDCWGGDGDALTQGLVENILRYYEVLGDYQMLSTIVCVLTFGRDRRRLSNSGSKLENVKYHILPKFHPCRFDNYLHRYSAMLYGWGIMTVRNEIHKRLAYGVPGAGGEIIKPMLPNTNDLERCKSPILSNPGIAPGITFSPFCLKCMEPVSDADICHACNDYAFQCSICCSAVRGLFTWCPLCNHGGHVDHIIPWFRRQNACPTGCGCICKIHTLKTAESLRP